MRRVLALVALGCGPTVATSGGSEGGDSSGAAATSSSGASVSESTGTTIATTTSADVSSDAEVSDDGGVFDMGGPAADLPPPRPCRFPDQPRSRELGQLWIAANSLGTVSKLDAATGNELAVYRTDPSGNGDPFYASVSLAGDAAIGASAGVTMIRGEPASCDDATNTSTGASDLRPWPDGCVAWHMPYTNAHAVAWTAGVPDEETCTQVDEKLWVAAAHPPHVLRVDGETGTIEDTINFMASDVPINNGAVDSAGNFWLGLETYDAVYRIDAETLAVDSWPWPHLVWGMAIDREDRPWVCGPSVGRFDDAAQSWDEVMLDQGFGCAMGYDDLLWSAEDPVLAIDTDTLAIAHDFDMPGNVYSVGVDFDGFVWGVAGEELRRIDPSDGTYEVFVRATQSATDGDFTGFGLALVSGYI